VQSQGITLCTEKYRLTWCFVPCMMMTHRIARRSGPPGEDEGLTPGGRARSGSERTTSRGMIRSSVDGASRLHGEPGTMPQGGGNGETTSTAEEGTGQPGRSEAFGERRAGLPGRQSRKRAHPPELAPTGEMLNEPRVTPDDRSAVDHPTRAALGGAPSPPTAAQPRAVAVFAPVARRIRGPPHPAPTLPSLRDRPHLLVADRAQSAASTNPCAITHISWSLIAHSPPHRPIPARSPTSAGS
jgi:hypothetical protein